MMEVVATTGAIKMWKAPVKSSPLTPTFYGPDALSVTIPTASEY